MANKKYPISQSPLFKLSSKKRLADLLGFSLNEIIQISKDSSPLYRVFMLDDREINEPIGKLRVIHDKLQKFLSRIEAPDYLYSGIKGRSSVGNAECHKDCRYMITMDITKFYNSTQKSNVRKLFKNTFRCEGDIAYLLTDLVCFQERIPTGSPLSQNLAYWTHQNMFHSINFYCEKNDIIFSLYVDDMTFSSLDKISLGLIGVVKGILSEYGLKINNRKTRKHGVNDYKLVTGCAISPKKEMRIQNKHKKKIIDNLSERSPNLPSIEGLISYCQTIESRFFQATKKQIRNSKPDK